MSAFKGLATGIGSLPYKDVDMALALVFEFLPNIPFWPQLPNRDKREGMVNQFSENLPCLSFEDNDLVYKSCEDSLEKFYEKIISGDRGYFKISKGFAQGLYALKQKLSSEPKLLEKIEFIKGHITGPFTFAASLKDDKGASLLHDQVFMQAIIKGLSMKALWEIDFFKEFGKKMIMFIDEPYLGAFGSAYTPINREDVVRGLGELTENIKTESALVGVHCCGNTDWSIFTDVKGIDIINFDAYSFSEKFVLYADSLRKFIDRGGLICWGIVPTQEFSGKETAAFLAGKLNNSIDILVKKGLNREKLLDSMILSPACGLGSLEPKKAEAILKLLCETSDLVRKKP